MKIYIDSDVTVPQYLVLRMLPVPRVGWLWKSGPAVARENRSRRILHGNEEEGKKEETLTVGETILARAEELKEPLRRFS
jgi:hypothetical protein